MCSSRINRFKIEQTVAKDKLDLMMTGMTKMANPNLERIQKVEEVKKEILRLTFEQDFLYNGNQIPNSEFTKILKQYKKSIILCYRQNIDINNCYDEELNKILKNYQEKINLIFG